MAESGAPETVIVWQTFMGIYGSNPGVEQPICGDETARAAVAMRSYPRGSFSASRIKPG
jgi:hypothetical protein